MIEPLLPAESAIGHPREVDFRESGLEALITAAGAQIIYLPPYSPDFSPLENCWFKIKSILRRLGARTYPDLLQALETAFAEVTIKNILGWFTHCCYCASVD
ncbi:transposase [Neosynechococcus sphagnicola]|uniref:transposase n=1 Tax=Neosynechococcus sphagnicola TaxID=1501145 RepID=UPI00138E3F08